MSTKGKVTGIVSNLVTVAVDGPVAENELCYITVAGEQLLAEVIKVAGDKASVQVFSFAVLCLIGADMCGKIISF